MSTLRVLGVSVGCAVAFATSAGAQDALPPGVGEAGRALLGCWDVVEGTWEPHRDGFYGTTVERPDDPVMDSATYQVPPRIRLVARPARRSANAGAIEVPPGALPTPHPNMAWALDGDSIRMSFGDGFTGVAVHLAVSDSALSGIAYTLSDNYVLDEAHQSFKRAVALARTDCDAPPPVSDALVRPMLQQIRLDGGGTLTLGASLPEGYETAPRRSGALTVVGRVTGLLPPTDSIIVQVAPDLGVITGIELRYFPSLSFEELAESVRAATGPLEPFVWEGEVLSWSAHSRTTSLRLSPGRDGGRHRVQITARWLRE